MLIASPGCYPTSILLPVLPLLRAGLIKAAGIIADSLSGVSGAGRKAELDYLFVECNESVRPYGVPKHRHLSEIEQELGAGRRRAGGHPIHAASYSGQSRHLDDALSHARETFREREGSRRVERKNHRVLPVPPMATNHSCGCWKARRCRTRKMSTART